ncbi:hypothetical protein QS306_09200 [Paraburkholderia bonniea]|uniref:hypothetical protein n=1 Tax=Paraburkholderia bonniea TaxID=2152891 RepID=UPI00129190E8|nr:hypothetical protein [Paraburkholderia bonniea]WJF89299.1 hypothetical protein QS306_09200 [Paraburkholderia bonniea]WJF92615.1 hypothetical protein QS308_09210 [Paraburkholderia bonniea]
MSIKTGSNALTGVCQIVGKRADDSAEKLRFARAATQAAQHETEELRQRVEQQTTAAKAFVTMLDRELSAEPATERKVKDNNARISAKYEELARLREAAKESEQKLQEARAEEIQARNVYHQVRRRQQKLEDTVTSIARADGVRVTRLEDNELDEVALQLHQQLALHDAREAEAEAGSGGNSGTAQEPVRASRAAAQPEPGSSSAAPSPWAKAQTGPLANPHYSTHTPATDDASDASGAAEANSLGAAR